MCTQTRKHLNNALIPCVAVAGAALTADAVAVAVAVVVLLLDEIALLTSPLPVSGGTCAELLSESTLGSLCSMAVPAKRR